MPDILTFFFNVCFCFCFCFYFTINVYALKESRRKCVSLCKPVLCFCKNNMCTYVPTVGWLYYGWLELTFVFIFFFFFSFDFFLFLFFLVPEWMKCLFIFQFFCCFFFLYFFSLFVYVVVGFFLLIFSSYTDVKRASPTYKCHLFLI